MGIIRELYPVLRLRGQMLLFLSQGSQRDQGIINLEGALIPLIWWLLLNFEAEILRVSEAGNVLGKKLMVWEDLGSSSANSGGGGWFCKWSIWFCSQKHNRRSFSKTIQCLSISKEYKILPHSKKINLSGKILIPEILKFILPVLFCFFYMWPGVPWLLLVYNNLEASVWTRSCPFLRTSPCWG